MNPPSPTPPPAGGPSPARLFLRRVVVKLLRARVWLTESGPGEIWESNYFWAVLVGLCGAFSSVFFREALSWIEWLLFRTSVPLEYVPATLPVWVRLLIPAEGGLLAGSILILGNKWPADHRSADYM